MDSILKARLEKIKKYQSRKVHIDDPAYKLFSAYILERIKLPNISDKDRKDYYILFDTWKEYLTSETLTEFNTKEELQDELKLIPEIYGEVKSPVVYTEEKSFWNPNPKHKEEYGEDQYYWGYAVIDFTKLRVKIFHDGLFDNCLNKIGTLGISKYRFYALEDVLFRKSSEVPEDYQWDGLEEYNGWLQFRWGDHKNSISRSRNKRKKKPDITKAQNKTESERLQHKFDVELDKKLSKERQDKFGW